MGNLTPRRRAACRALLHGVAMLALAAPAATASPPDDAPTADRPPVAEDAAAPEGPAGAEERVRAERIEKLVAYFAEMYGGYLEGRDWIARSMATLGLARIDDPLISRRLVEVMTGDREPAVRLYAWAALHARLDRLTDAQKEAWAEAGRTLAMGGELRGDLRVGLVRWIGPEGPTPRNVSLFLHLFETTNSTSPVDMPTLQAMRDVLAGWRDTKLIRELVDSMVEPAQAYRAEYLLSGLDLGVPRLDQYEGLGLVHAWRKVRVAWQQKVRRLRTRPLEPRPLPPYEGGAAVLPPPERIQDPADPKWRAELELPRFKLDHFDVSFALDTTGSMRPVIEWMKRDIDRMMRVLHLLSYEPRIGLTFYRDKGDAYVVKSSPLTDRLDLLRDALAGARAAGGGDLPEAVYEAVEHVLNRQKWSSGHYARRAVVLVGDAPPHPDRMLPLRVLVTGATEEGFRFYTIKCGRGARSLPEFDEIAEWGRGASLAADFASGEGKGGLRKVLYRDPQTRRRYYILHGVADAAGAEGPSRQLIREIVRLAMPEAYLDRTGPFLDVFLEYAEDPGPEERLLPRALPAWLH